MKLIMTIRRGPAAAALLVAALAAAAGVTACGDRTEPAPAAGRPHVLILVMDTTRADRCSVTGYGRPTTPRIDEFARDAVTYTDAWSPSPWTPPAHASLFTGLRPTRHGVTEGGRGALRDEQVTLAEHFRDAGWRTACFTNNAHISPQRGLSQGFEHYDPPHTVEERPYPYARPTHVEAGDWAVKVARAGERFFLFINDMEPHAPYTPPQEVASAFVSPGADPDDVSWATTLNYPVTMGFSLFQEEFSPEKLKVLSDHYDAEVATLDREVGALLDRLRAEGLLDETLVVICSDHGENLGDHHLMEHGMALYRSLLHVPLVIRLPGRFDGGRRVDDLVRLEDVPPTLLTLCGLPVPEMDGVSLTEPLGGRIARGYFGRAMRYVEEIQRHYPNVDPSVFDRTIQSVYDGRWHYIATSDGGVELFDVDADPAELHNLALENPRQSEEIVRRLRARR